MMIRLMVAACMLSVALPGADEIIRVEASEPRGFHWPYFLSIPQHPVAPTFILVEPNVGRSNDDPKVHEEGARTMIGARILDPDIAELGSPILIPAFPRPRTNWRLYTHALDRDTLEAEDRSLRRIDLQLLAMISDARERLAARGIRVQSKVFMWGYSAPGTFTSRFVTIHPRAIKAAVLGGCSIPVLPLAVLNARPLRYPIGIADLNSLTGKQFDAKGFRNIPLQIFRGDQDTNDEVAFADGFDAADRDLINELLGGSPPINRYAAIRAIYRKFASQAEFVIEEGVGHDDTRTRREGMRFLNRHRK